MTALVLAVSFTIGISAFCSLLEAIVLSTSPTEIEALKKKHARKGELLEKLRGNLEETSSAILGLNTIANTWGATMSGALAVKALAEGSDVYFSLSLVVAILIFSEVIPKNIGVIYRKSLHSHIVYPLWLVWAIMYPVSLLCKGIVRIVAGKNDAEEIGDEEIKLLAQKSADDGTLTQDESTMISNALSLDDVRIADIMTPRTVVTALDKDLTINEIFQDYRNIPFARMPVFEDNIDQVVGLVRRRDLLKAKAEDQDSTQISEILQEITYIPENINGAQALQQLLKTHQQLAVVVDEFGSMSGVVTMEDIMEHILGKEIFEKDDVAIDMREFARRKKIREDAEQQKEESASELKEGLAG